MREIFVNVVAASSLAISPAAVSEVGAVDSQRAYIREEDERSKELAIIAPETGNHNRSYSPGKALKAGHFVHRLAARHNQMGHRFRADTR